MQKCAVLKRCVVINNGFLLLIYSCLFLQSCGVLFLREEDIARKKYLEQQQQYEPYRQQKTIEGYKEFIKKYPKNTFVQSARHEIASLEFAPYEQLNTIEDYMEFVIRYPDNPNTAIAVSRIEQMDYKRYESMDTIEGYREFLIKYPRNTFSILAKEHLQELEFRARTEELQTKYGFDLLLYRLQVKRLQKELQPAGGVNLGDFTLFASVDTVQEKTYFHTHLIYSGSLPALEASPRESAEEFFNIIIARLLTYLDTKFANKQDIDGFSFDVSSSAHRFYGDKLVWLEYYFPLPEVHLFAQGNLDGKQLLARSTIVVPEKTAPRPAGQEEPTLPANMDGPEIMQRVSARDRGRDSIISRSWQRTLKTGRVDTMDTIEKWKDFSDTNDFVDKLVVRYVNFPEISYPRYATAMLILNYKEKAREYWYVMRRGDAGRTVYIDKYRPPAESDFSLTDYIHINCNEESHTLVRDEQYKDIPCFVVESTPVNKDLCYGKRISWIDKRRWTPVKIDYFDKEGAPWKRCCIAWQSRFGLWFWDNAVIENVQTGDKTLITTRDVRSNVGLPEIDFNPRALERLTGK